MHDIREAEYTADPAMQVMNMTVPCRFLGKPTFSNPSDIRKILRKIILRLNPAAR